LGIVFGPVAVGVAVGAACLCIWDSLLLGGNERVESGFRSPLPISRPSTEIPHTKVNILILSANGTTGCHLETINDVSGKSNDSFAPNSRQGKEERLLCGTSVRQNHHDQLALVSTLAFERFGIVIEKYFENLLSFSKQPTSVVAL